MQRPAPPAEVIEASDEPRFIPALDLAEWARGVFLDSTSRLYSETHADIAEARIGWLWTCVPNRRQGRDILGEASLAVPSNRLSGWNKAAQGAQLAEWFADWWNGEPADFKIVIYAPWFNEAEDVDALALIKHELLHCRHAVNRFGSPRWAHGRPVWGVRAHDVQEFVEVVDYFGAGIIDGSIDRLVKAANHPPLAGKASIAQACGTCIRMVG